MDFGNILDSSMHHRTIVVSSDSDFFLIHFVWKRRHIASAHESPIVDAENLVSMVPAIELILDSAIGCRCNLTKVPNAFSYPGLETSWKALRHVGNVYNDSCHSMNKSGSMCGFLKKATNRFTLESLMKFTESKFHISDEF